MKEDGTGMNIGGGGGGTDGREHGAQVAGARPARYRRL